jgi:nucleoside 2-deoxyribosyltransferase
MKVYVAAKFEDKLRAREVMDTFRKAGDTITYDWTEDNSAFNEAQAKADLAGVEEADIFVGIFEKDLAYCGALVEMGMAIANDIPVYLLGSQLDNKCIFTLLRGVERINNVESICSKRQRSTEAV